MVNQLGIKINHQEAKVLLGSADANPNEIMSIDEFIDLVHNENEVLNQEEKKRRNSKAPFKPQKTFMNRLH